MRAYLHGLLDLTREIYTRNKRGNTSQIARQSVSDYSFSHYLFGKMYQEGRHVERDDSVAYYWIRMAAEHGCAIAQYELGDIYQRGGGRGCMRIESLPVPGTLSLPLEVLPAVQGADKCCQSR